jgi:CRISPR system Cascade subunit CasB
MSERKWEEELVERLTELANPANPKRGVLARLRRALTAPSYFAMMGTNGLFRMVPELAEERAILSAGLFAWAKGNCPQAQGVSFGAAFGAGLTLEEKQQREKRFIDLLDTDREDLPYKLRQAITLISRDGIGLDWVLLVRHLGHWTHPDRWVQKEWARGFWAAPEKETPANQEQPVSD